ncbi:MAG: HupE/UreJ family protein [Stellaceae bacterium]
MLRIIIFCVTLSVNLSAASAHLASDSYLRLDIDADGRVTGQWDIALRDLDVAVGLDTNMDGDITWGELRSKRRAVEGYAFSRLNIAEAAGSCRLRPDELMVDYHAGNAYAVIPFAADCPAFSGQLTLRYRLLFELDPTHRGLLTLAGRGITKTDILTPDHATVTVDLAPRALTGEIARFFLFGFDHILLGYDHLLFVGVLLVMASLRRAGRSGWVPIDGLGQVMLETVKILTGFTIAHAITLSLAVLGVIHVPSRLIEPAVALTIMLAAADNLFPILPPLRWHVAFLFGLIHGLAFAGVLGPMQLPPLRLALALGCFNLGVEAGQICLALLLVPIAFLLRRELLYRRLVVPAVSSSALALAGVWLMDRLFALDLLSLSPTAIAALR